MKTLGQIVKVRGIGLHTGAKCKTILSPAEPGHGLVFRTHGVVIPALHNFVVDTRRCTVLGRDGAWLSTVEHLLSACIGLGVTDCLIECDAPELPIGDGSALLWTDAMGEAGTVTTSQESPPFLTEEVKIKDDKGSSFIRATIHPFPEPGLSCVTVAVDWEGHPLVETQTALFLPNHGEEEDGTREDEFLYVTQIAPARTFGFIEEIEALRAMGLAKGGSTENAIVIYPDRYDPPLRFPNELARHKLLDLLGDIALAGIGLPEMSVMAYKPSHRLNVRFAQALADAHARGKVAAIPA